jgi:hypothetical protein
MQSEDTRDLGFIFECLFVNMVKQNSQPAVEASVEPRVEEAAADGEGGRAAGREGVGTVSKKKSFGLKSTLMAIIALIITLVLVYYALTFLMGSDFNIDTLLTGERVTRLP